MPPPKMYYNKILLGGVWTEEQFNAGERMDPTDTPGDVLGKGDLMADLRCFVKAMLRVLRISPLNPLVLSLVPVLVWFAAGPWWALGALVLEVAILAGVTWIAGSDGYIP